MCNCGRQRQNLAPAPGRRTSSERQRVRLPSAGLPAVGLVFEYVGATALTVFGAVSGVRYRFIHAGARVAVDARDADAMRTVPNLRREQPVPLSQVDVR